MKNAVNRLLEAPILSDRQAFLAGIIAVGIPTSVRAAVDGMVAGCEFTPFLPFVLIAAILLGWRAAVLVALASVAVLGGLFSGFPAGHMTQSCFLSGAGIFLASSALIIGTVVGVRHALAKTQLPEHNEPADGIIFSLEKGQVWASWHGNGPPVRLGSKKRVGAMMEDFLAQVELGNRLLGKSD
jgi:hypothetical protein